MNNNQSFVNAVIDAIQVWNRGDDKEPTYSENIDQKAVNRFVYSELIGGEI